MPTKFSIDGIVDVLNFCKKYGIFASIGELEQAGEVVNNNLNEKLSISHENIVKLKEEADKYIEGSYMRPICPCILTGLHIDNFGNCIVDKDTGLNCKWFLLKNPSTIKIGNIKQSKICDLFNKVNNYREHCFDIQKGIVAGRRVVKLLFSFLLKGTMLSYMILNHGKFYQYTICKPMQSWYVIILLEVRIFVHRLVCFYMNWNYWGVEC